jgi:hypothetical protein
MIYVNRSLLPWRIYMQLIAFTGFELRIGKRYMPA